jgi:hypothetical protein
LFEASIDAPQNTPSAHRVRVDSSPAASSPLRLLSSILGDSSPESRAHPDPTKDVWEIAVWDPIPSCLRLFCLFGPGHVLVYLLFLPTIPADPRPSVTVFTTIILQILISSQLMLLQSSFIQQERDKAVINKEVMSEYDIKYVHPRLDPVVRDVGTQYSSTASGNDEEEGSDVDTYTPAVVLRRGFRTNPNPNYAKHVDPDNVSHISERPKRAFSPPQSYTPSAYGSRETTPFTGMTPLTAIRQPRFRQSTPGSLPPVTSTGDGGSLGIYSHANSPLKKTTSLSDMQGGPNLASPRDSYSMAGREIQEERERQRSRSPAKRQSDGSRPILPKTRAPFPGIEEGRRTSAPTAFGRKSKHGANESPLKNPLPRW